MPAVELLALQPGVVVADPGGGIDGVQDPADHLVALQGMHRVEQGVRQRGPAGARCSGVEFASYANEAPTESESEASPSKGTSIDPRWFELHVRMRHSVVPMKFVASTAVAPASSRAAAVSQLRYDFACGSKPLSVGC